MIHSFSVGKSTISAKRLAEQDPNYEKLLPTTKAKTKSSSQFTFYYSLLLSVKLRKFLKKAKIVTLIIQAVVGGLQIN